MKTLRRTDAHLRSSIGLARALALAVMLALPAMSHAAVVVDLDATQLPEGPLASWANNGSLGGNFTSAGSVVPRVTTVAGAKGIAFLGGTGGGDGTHYLGPVAPPTLTGPASRTVEAWVYNPSAQPEEVVFGWGRRNGPDGSNVSFNHGTDPNFGAVGHWGAPDIGWNGQIDFNRWSYIVYSYDSATMTTTVYKDGQVANTETGVTLNTHSTSTASTPLNFRVARQNAGGGGPSGVGVGEITIARIRVHDVALPAATILDTYDAELGDFGLRDTDGDGLPDGYEAAFPFLNPNDPNDAGMDFDNDGLTNLAEFQRGTGPGDSDSDDDGALDGAEVNRMDGGVAAPTNPLRRDSDGDFLPDGAETDTGVFVSNTDTGSDPLTLDTDADTYSDGHEVIRASNPNDPSSIPDLSAPTPLVNLDAAGLSDGPLGTWPNTGALPGDFLANPGAAPAVTSIQFIRGVQLDGVNHYYTGPGAPEFITGNKPRTIEAWVFNPVAADEETIFSWGRRGGPDGSNMSFNHGVNATFGAVGHWGAGPDMGWAGNIAAGRWTYVAYTFNPANGTASVYQDGNPANSEVIGVLNTHGTDSSPAANRLPFRVGSQNEPTGAPTAGLRGSMAIAKLRVYEVALDATTIFDNFMRDSDEFGLNDDDGDGMPTWYERLFSFLDPNNPDDGPADQDGDGATNQQEFENGSHPEDPDSDNDGALDGAEIHRMAGGMPAPTNPLRPDTDYDGLSDSVETGTGVFTSNTDTGTDPLQVDTDGDTFGDGQEVFHNSNPLDPGSTPDFSGPPVAIINLDATTHTPGPLASWPNSGALGGVFLAGANVPAVGSSHGVRAIDFDGVDHLYTGPGTPNFLAGNSRRTVEAWLYNPEVAGEENIFAWGSRGGPDGSNMSFNHGTDPAFGAVGHWGPGPDIGWAGNISTGRWTFVAYTYDPATQTGTVYRDGQVANSEGAIGLNTHLVDSFGNALPFRVAAQNEPNGSATPNLRGSMSIAKIRVYDDALTAEEIATHYANEVDQFTLTCPDHIIVSTEPGQCTATVTFNAVADSCSPASGSTFPIGATTVTCVSGAAQCSFTITVNDSESPTLNCPQNLVVGTDPSQCSATVNDYGVTAIDCPGTTVTCSPPAGTSFALGSTTVTCTATDPSENVSTCTFAVTVEDREAPHLSIRAGANPAGKIAAKSNGSGFYQLLASDNCDASPGIFVKDALSSTVFGPYPSGATIKLTSNSGENKSLKGAGAVAAHILTAGSAEIYASDAAGNVSTPVTR